METKARSLSKIPPHSEFLNAGAYHSSNELLATAPYYDIFENGNLPPIFALLSNYLSTNYPGVVRRVILEVDDMPQVGSDDDSICHPPAAREC